MELLGEFVFVTCDVTAITLSKIPYDCPNLIILIEFIDLIFFHWKIHKFGAKIDI